MSTEEYDKIQKDDGAVLRDNEVQVPIVLTRG